MILSVTIDDAGRISNDTLYDLYAVLRRNRTPECNVCDRTLMRQVIDLAMRNLRSTHAYIASFADGSCVIFTGTRRPPGVSAEAVVATAKRELENGHVH